MKNRSVFAVIALSLLTLGIYMIIWQVKTKNEMNGQGAKIPSAWLMLVPLVNLWWIWKYCEGVDTTTKGALTAPIGFILLFLMPLLGVGIIQNAFNKTRSEHSVQLASARAM